MQFLKRISHRTVLAIVAALVVIGSVTAVNAYLESPVVRLQRTSGIELPLFDTDVVYADSGWDFHGYMHDYVFRISPEVPQRTLEQCKAKSFNIGAYTYDDIKTRHVHDRIGNYPDELGLGKSEACWKQIVDDDGLWFVIVDNGYVFYFALY